MSSPGANPACTILEKDVPFSQSLLWQRQRDLYIERGARAWSDDRIPNFITNNPFIAEIYARIVAAFLADCTASSSPSNPLRILEIGGGVGKFAFLFLRHLEQLLPAQGMESIRYTLADCSPALLQTWRENPYLAQFAVRGVLDFELACDQVPASWIERSSSGPRVLIANYVLDSLPHNAFQIKAGEISELLLTTSAPDTAAALRALNLSFNAAPAAAPRYADPKWNALLEQYRGVEATLLFPSGPLRLLQPLLGADVPLLVLAGDKGFTRPEALAFSQGPPALEFHSENYFSVMTNFDAIGKYFSSCGGEALLPEKHFSSFDICGFLHGRPPDGFPATSSAYRQSRQAFGPDDLFTLMAWLNPHLDRISPPEILALLRLTHCDPIAFLRMFPALARQLGAVRAEREELRKTIHSIWANHFPVTAAENEIPFACGVVLLGLGFPAEALPFFEASERSLGPSATTSYNLALCCQALGRAAETLAHARQACSLDPDFEPACALLQKLSPPQA